MLNEDTLLVAGNCSVEAPAGCGKTELIARTLKIAPDKNRYLVLTHTHAGVRALRQRLKKHKVPAGRSRVDTIASWALDYATSYPETTGCTNSMPATDAEWDGVYLGMVALLEIPAIQRVVRVTYDAVFVDEYQDCTEGQHRLVVGLSKILPCKVLGDPLQAIFHFRGRKVSWITDVESSFPSLGQLTTPWRWKGKNEPLGLWLMQIRDALKTGGEINLQRGALQWQESSRQNQIRVAKELLDAEGDVIAIRKRAAGAHDFASCCRGYSSMEETQCNALLAFAKDLDALTGHQRSLAVVKFSAECATTISTFLGGEIKKLRNGLPLSPTRTKNVHKLAAITALDAVADSKDIEHVQNALRILFKLPNAKIYRWDLLYAASDAFKAMKGGDHETVWEAAWTSRNRSRYLDRKLSGRLVSRTLLVKGLEFEHALVVDADEFKDAHGAQNFYVAVSRGSTSLSVLSAEPVIRFAVPNL